MAAYGTGGSRGRGRQSAAPAPDPLEQLKQLPPGMGGLELYELILCDDDTFKQTIFAQIQNERRRNFKIEYPKWKNTTVYEGTGRYVTFSPPRNGLGRIFEIASSNMLPDNADPWVYLRVVSFVTENFYTEIIGSNRREDIAVLVGLARELLNEAIWAAGESFATAGRQYQSVGETARAYEQVKLAGISDTAKAGKIALAAVFDQATGVPDGDKQPFGPQLQRLWETIVRVRTFPAMDDGHAQFADEKKDQFYQALMAVTRVFPQFFVAPQVPTTRVEIQYAEPKTPLTNMFATYKSDADESDEDGSPAVAANFSDPEIIPYSSGDDLDQYAPGMPLPGPSRDRRRAPLPSDSGSSSSSSDSEGSLSPAEDTPFPTEDDSKQLRKIFKRRERHPNGSSSEDESSSSSGDDGKPPNKRLRLSTIRAALQLERGDPVKAAARLLKAMRIY